MYHIKPDRRSQRTAAEIIRGMQECLKTIPLSAITVSDIHRATGISRATFYRLFDTPEDVLHYLCTQAPVEEAARLAEVEATNPGSLFVQLVHTGMENHDLLKALVDNGRYDLIHDYTERRFRSLDALYPILPRDISEAQYDYMISALSMTMVATLATWVRRGRVESAEELSAYITDYFLRLARLADTAQGEK